MAVPNTFTNGTVANADEVNANFAYVGLVPIGAIIPWNKNFGDKRTSSVTSISTGKLVDSGASFDSTYLNKIVANVGFTETNSKSTTSDGVYATLKTIIINSLGTDGVFLTNLSCNYTNNCNPTRLCYMKATIYFTDSTTEDSSVNSVANGVGTSTFTITTQNKKVWKIDWKAYVAGSVTTGGITISSSTAVFNPVYSTFVSAIDSGTQLSLDSGKFDVSNTSCLWKYKIFKTTKLDEIFVECNGQVLSDAESDYNGETIQNLNNSIYLKGSLTSGTSSTFGTTGTNYSNYSVVYIMRVK